MIEVFYLMIPAYVANMMPVFARSLPGKMRVDFGFTFRGEPLFGSHKTWKGLLLGTTVGTFVGVMLAHVYWPFSFSPFIWSFLAAFGALVGDLIKSFFKRRVGIKSGKSWVPFDQMDFTVGALAFGSIVYFPGWLAAAIVVLASVFLHIAVNHISYYTGIRDEKW